MVLDAADEGNRLVGRAGRRTGAVPHGLGQPIADAKTPLVPERDRVPAAGLEDDQMIGRPPAGQVARAPRAALFLDGRDQGELIGAAGGLGGNGHDGRGQWPFGIHGAPAVERVSLAAHGNPSGDGVHVTEQDDLFGPASPEGDHVAHLVARARPGRAPPGGRGARAGRGARGGRGGRGWGGGAGGGGGGGGGGWLGGGAGWGGGGGGRAAPARARRRPGLRF